MIDLDEFKRLNDTRGHTEGDLVLAAVGHLLRGVVRPDAVVGRVGGEEFLIADAVAESEPQDLGREICDAIAGLPFSVTASVGIASMRCDHLLWGRDPADAVAAAADADADVAMYSAKRPAAISFVTTSVVSRAVPLSRGGRTGSAATLFSDPAATSPGQRHVSPDQRPRPGAINRASSLHDPTTCNEDGQSSDKVGNSDREGNLVSAPQWWFAWVPRRGLEPHLLRCR